MKKMFFISLAFCLGLGMMSCGNNAKAGAAADSTATEEVKAEAPAKKVDVKEVIAKAKAEGANWDEAQWKAAFEDMFTGLDPMFQVFRDMEAKQKSLENASEEEQAKAALEMMAEAEKMEKEYKGLEEAMDEFNKIVEANPVAKKLSDDKAFQAEMQKKFNLPDM
jgi:hypothetical protein